MIRLLLTALGAGLTIWLILVAFVVIREKTLPEADPMETDAIIVLGAQVKEDGTLSVQLQWRLDTALALYRQNPQPVVVCGAQGTNEPMAEARAMRDYLEQNGVPGYDILMEDTSFNTRQNLENARKLLPESAKKVLIVTSDYHLPRALALAEDTGLEAVGRGSPIKAEYWIKNHFREALAWVKYWLQSLGVLSR